jgi:hypothetical protein
LNQQLPERGDKVAAVEAAEESTTRCGHYKEALEARMQRRLPDLSKYALYGYDFFPEQLQTPSRPF